MQPVHVTSSWRRWVLPIYQDTNAHAIKYQIWSTVEMKRNIKGKSNQESFPSKKEKQKQDKKQFLALILTLDKEKGVQVDSRRAKCPWEVIIREPRQVLVRAGLGRWTGFLQPEGKVSNLVDQLVAKCKVTTEKQIPQL